MNPKQQPVAADLTDADATFMALVRSYGDAREDGNWDRAMGWMRAIMAALAALSPHPHAAASEPDMRAICETLGFDPTNHHNAAKCPYCRPAVESINGHDSRCPAAYPGGTNCTCERAAASSTEPASEPIYQVRNTFLSDPPNVWRDAEVFAYDVSPEEDRRIVYAAPTPAVAVPASLTDAQINALREKDAQPAPIEPATRADAAEAGQPRNTGHGHVFPRPDGLLAKCGGPRMCLFCKGEASRL